MTCVIMPNHHNRLRIHRKRHGLSQADVAFLLGCRSSAKSSRYEKCVRRPSIQTVFAFELIFGIPNHELFAGLYDLVRHKTLKRAELLLQRLMKAGPASRGEKITRLKEIIRSTQSANPDRKLP